MKFNRSAFKHLLVLSFAMIGSVQLHAQTSFNSGGNIATAADWTNGLPNVGNDGTIAVDGILADFPFNNSAVGTVAVSHTAGTLTGWTNMYNPSATLYQWTQSGGTVSILYFLVINKGVTYELTGTGVINYSAGRIGGDRLQVVNAGSCWVQSGGTTDGVALAFENTGTTVHTLSGGVGLNVGASWIGGAAIRVLNATVNVTGDYSATINPGFSNASGLSSGVLSMEGTGVLNFSSSWTGSLTQSAFSGTTKWQTALTQTGVKVNGTQVTAGNFGNFFEITDSGTVVKAAPPPIGGTNFVSGDVATDTDWSNGLPAPGNDGSIAASGTLNTFALNVDTATIVTQYAGTLTGTPNIQNTGTGTVLWTQSGGIVSASDFMVINSNVAYELTGSGLIHFASTTGGSRLQVVNAGSWLQSGGTTDGVALAFEDATGPITLSGGEGLNVGASWAGGAAIRVLNATVNVTGNYRATLNPAFINPTGTSDGVLSMEGTGILDFSTTWTGSLTQSAFFNDPTKWQDVLTQTGVTVDGTQITADNFASYFTIANHGATVVRVGSGFIEGTSLIAGDAAISTHWTNNLPSPGTDGSIAASGTLNTLPSTSQQRPW